MIVACDKKNGTLYMTTNRCKFITIVGSTEDLNLWHLRPNHMSTKGLEIKHLNEKVSCLKLIHVDMCKSSISGKQKIVSFKKVIRTLKEARLKLVHIDV